MFIRFPYTDLYALNLDWILQKIKEFELDDQTIKDLIESLGTVVNSVNGQSGDVTISDTMIAGAKLEAVYVAPNVPWTNIVGNITNLYNSGIRIIVCGTNDRDLYVLKMSGGNVDYARYNPLGSASTFVESVNGQSGAISITDAMINATDINIFEWADPGETINDYTSATLLTLFDNGIRFILTQNSYGDYANLYTLYKSGNTVQYVEYAPTGAIAGVSSVNGQSGVVTLTAPDVGAVPTTRTVNGRPLSADITLTSTDIGAVPSTRTVNSKALSTNITLNASDVGAVPTTRTVNNKALSSDITLSASDVSAVPTTRTVNNKALSSDITLSASDVGAIPDTRAVGTMTVNKNLGTTPSLSCVKNGNVVQINARTYNLNTPTNISPSEDVFTLPAGFRPQSAQSLLAITATANYNTPVISVVNVGTDGSIRITNTSNYYHIWVVGTIVL